MRVALGSIAVAVSLAVAADAQAPAANPTFEVVSVRRSAPETGSTRTANVFSQRPDGAITATPVFIGNLIGRAYPSISSAEIVGLPDWAFNEFFDIRATSPLTAATPEQRAAMLRAMLADRFQLLAHTERRELPSYDLLVDRKDGRLGSALVPTNTDCDALNAARRAGTAPPPVFDADKPEPCVIIGSMDLIRGEAAISVLAQMLRASTGRLVVDKTGLRGAYRMSLKFDLAVVALGAVAPPENALSVFTAVREQLGLRLEPSRTERDVLVIDRLERPTEN
jgi:uncharacterized protein (TIGR03435 family)